MHNDILNWNTVSHLFIFLFKQNWKITETLLLFTFNSHFLYVTTSNDQDIWREMLYFFLQVPEFSWFSVNQLFLLLNHTRFEKNFISSAQPNSTIFFTALKKKRSFSSSFLLSRGMNANKRSVANHVHCKTNSTKWIICLSSISQISDSFNKTVHIFLTYRVSGLLLNDTALFFSFSYHFRHNHSNIAARRRSDCLGQAIRNWWKLAFL